MKIVSEDDDGKRHENASQARELTPVPLLIPFHVRTTHAPTTTASGQESSPAAQPMTPIQPANLTAPKAEEAPS